MVISSERPQPRQVLTLICRREIVPHVQWPTGLPGAVAAADKLVTDGHD
jgi:hypothetical protein